MSANGTAWRASGAVAACLLAVLSLASTGCQVQVAGQTLPSPYYLQDDVQHYAAGPEFKLSNEAAAMKAYKAEAAGATAPAQR